MKRYFSILAVTCIIVLNQLNAENAMAQQWAISNPPVTESVPQYRSSYPLMDKPADLEPKTIPRPVDIPAPVITPLPAIDGESTADKPVEPQSIVFPPPQKAEPSVKIEEHAPVSIAPRSYGLDYEPYRNSNPYPIDPRKPCNNCTHPPQGSRLLGNKFPGIKGQPYRPAEPGGCRCGKRGCPKCRQASVYWSRPLAAVGNQAPGHCWLPVPKKRLSDKLDPLSSFKLIPYQRTDNGYCGRGADPYGCLGESRQ